jgi:hypothetical protein
LYSELILSISSVEIWQVGTITLTTLTGLLIFTSFLLVATANAIIIVSVLMSLAAAGGFLALSFACLVEFFIKKTVSKSSINSNGAVFVLAFRNLKPH